MLSTENTGNAKTVLVVDDDPDIRDVLSMILDMDGYTVRTVSNGGGVSHSITKKKPDLILLDVILGDSDGRDICRSLKNDPITKDLPVLSLARGDETTKPTPDLRNTPVDKKPKKEVFYKGRNFR